VTGARNAVERQQGRELAAPDQLPPDDDRNSPSFVLRTIAEAREHQRELGPRSWLIRGLWPADAYGVHASEPKAGKSWNALDLAVSVASGTPWLGHFPIDRTGPALLFLGEGGEGAALRRLDAIAAAKMLRPDELPVAISERVPHLGDYWHRVELSAAVERYAPVLVVLDPFYLAARGARSGDVYAMGELLQAPQTICQDAGAALIVVHHYNRNREMKGAARMTGAGPTEWGRVLISADVISRYTDPCTQETRVSTRLDVIGGEVADQTFTVHRRIRADEPDDLDSPLVYDVTVVDDSELVVTVLPEAAPATQRVLTVLTDSEREITVVEIGDELAKTGHPLKKRTIQNALSQLDSLVDSAQTDAKGTRHYWLRRVQE
jgi:hypothetical protein